MEENDFPAKDFLSIQWRHPLLRFHLSHFKGANVNPGISFLLSQLGLGKQSNIEIPNSRYVNLQRLVEACDQSNRGEIKSATLRLSHLFKRMGPRLGYRITNLARCAKVKKNETVTTPRENRLRARRAPRSRCPRHATYDAAVPYVQCRGACCTSLRYGIGLGLLC